jgi:mitofilin
MQRRWLREVQVHVEEERGGRLAKLENLATDLKRLERITLDNAAYLDENLRLHAVWSALRALQTASLDAPVCKPFRNELRILKNIASAAGQTDKVTIAAIESLEESDAPDVGVEPLADLVTWFTPRVSAVALIPDHSSQAGPAGLLSHLASSVVSVLRFRRRGLVEGDDPLSVMARAEYYLNEDLDSATRELNQLKGPAKVLLHDWLAAARRRLEVQQALEVRKV